MKTLIQWTVLLSSLAFITACESSVDLSSDDEGSSGGEVAQPSGDVAGTTTNSPTSGSSADFAGIHWIHHNVSGWAQTASLNASVSGSKVILDSNKSKVWPAKDNVNASAWVLFSYNGQAYASTFDYLRPGQTTKGADFYIPIPGGGTWRPSSGERVGFMVSGLARDSRRNVSERSNVDWVTWP